MQKADGSPLNNTSEPTHCFQNLVNKGTVLSI